MLIDDAKVVRGWLNRGIPAAIIADALGCTVDDVMRVPSRYRANFAPIPSEMQDALDAVQANWTPATREARQASGDYRWLD